MIPTLSFSEWSPERDENSTGVYYNDLSGCGKTKDGGNADCWIQYAGGGGRALSKEERKESERRLLEQRLFFVVIVFCCFFRLWRCHNSDGLPKDECTKENLHNFPNVQRDIRVATKMREYHEHVRRCKLLDDLRRGAITPEMIGL